MKWGTRENLMNKKGRIIGMLAAALVAAGLLGACKSPVSDPPAKDKTAKGRLTVTIEGFAGQENLQAQWNFFSGERTVNPDFGTTTFSKYELSFSPTSGGAAHAAVNLTGGTGSVSDLVPGTYTVTATAYTGTSPAVPVAEKALTGITILEDQTSTASFLLEPRTGGANGTFDYAITLGTGITGQLVIETTTGTQVEDIALSAGANNTPVSLAPGVYYVWAQLAKGSKEAGFNETLHIYTGLSSALAALTYDESDLHEVSVPLAVSDFDLTTLFDAPAKGTAPAEGFTGDEYRGAIAWKAGGADFNGAAFGTATVYTAVVTLTARPGYTFDGVTAPAYVHGTVNGTTGAENNVVTLVFPATEPAMGNLNASIGFGNYGAIAISGSNGTNAIEKPAGTLELSVADAEYTDPVWYVDGNPTAVSTVLSVTLSAAEYGNGPHSVTFRGTKGGIPYSQIVPFSVQQAPEGLVSAAELADVLAALPVGTPEAPSVIKLDSTVDVNSSPTWQTVYDALNGVEKYITLDLSLCSATGNIISGTMNNPTSSHFNYIRGDYVVGIILPNSLTEIGTGTLRNWPGLRYVTIPNGVTSIGNNAFTLTPNLAAITIPNSVVTIKQAVFSSSGLTSIIIPASVTSLGYRAFYITTNTLRSVTFMGSGIIMDESFTGDLATVYAGAGTGTYTSTDGTTWTKN
jgi:hypothetical protein